MVTQTWLKISAINLFYSEFENNTKMKQLKYITVFGMLFFFASCIKQIDKTINGPVVAEIDATPLNSSNATAGYPVLTRIPAFARPVSTADSTLRRLNGIVKIRINLVGPQSGTDQTVGYKIMPATPLTTIAFPATASGQTPAAAAATLSVSNATVGTHFTALSGLCTIPANSSFGTIDVSVLNSVASAGQARFLGIQLDSTGTIKPNPNYNRLGLILDQR